MIKNRFYSHIRRNYDLDSDTSRSSSLASDTSEVASERSFS